MVPSFFSVNYPFPGLAILKCRDKAGQRFVQRVSLHSTDLWYTRSFWKGRISYHHFTILYPRWQERRMLPYGTHEPKAEMTRSSGTQQAERTAVRTAPIVCPEESLWPSAVCGHSAMSARDAASMGSSSALTPEGFQRGTKGSGYPVDTTAEGG